MTDLDIIYRLWLLGLACTFLTGLVAGFGIGFVCWRKVERS